MGAGQAVQAFQAERVDQASAVDHIAAEEADHIVVADRMAAGHTVAAADREGRRKEPDPAVQGAARTVAERAGHIAAEEVVRIPAEEAGHILVEGVDRKEVGHTVAVEVAVDRREKEQQHRGMEPVQGKLELSASGEPREEHLQGQLRLQARQQRQRRVPEWFEVY